MDRLLDVDAFPVGTRVVTPTGRLGVVVAHKGAHSKRDEHERCVVRFTGRRGGGRDRGTVELLPNLLKHASEGPQLEFNFEEHPPYGQITAYAQGSALHQ